jgi:ABC-2 type transport system permease protein
MTSVEALGRYERIGRLPLEKIGQKSGVFLGFATSISALWQHRELAFLLARREVKARYSDSSLGLMWSLIRPLAQLLVYYFFIGEVLGAARQIPSFAIFIFIGLTGWTYFAEIVSRATSSIVTNQGIIKKVYLPREIFPLASLGSALFTLAVQGIVFLGAVAVSGGIPSIRSLPYAALGILVLTVFGLAVGTVLSAVNVYLRDVEHMVEVFLIVFFWVSPIVYSFSQVYQRLGDGIGASLYLANPVTAAILGLQRGLWTAGAPGTGIDAFPPHLGQLLLAVLGVSLVLLWAAQRIFARLQGNFAQEL